MRTFILFLTVFSCSVELYNFELTNNNSNDIIPSNEYDVAVKHRVRRAEKYWMCVDITVQDGVFEVMQAEKEWGKWVTRPWGAEVDPPQGKQLRGNGDNLLICSAGRSDSATGTEASIVLREMTSNARWKIYWDVPYIGADTFKYLDYDPNKLTIWHEEYQKNWHKFTLTTRK